MTSWVPAIASTAPVLNVHFIAIDLLLDWQNQESFNRACQSQYGERGR